MCGDNTTTQAKIWGNWVIMGKQANNSNEDNEKKLKIIGIKINTKWTQVT